jgi:hypothetical protein
MIENPIITGNQYFIRAKALIFQAFYNPSLKAGVISFETFMDFSPEELTEHP